MKLFVIACLLMSAAVPAQANSYYFDGNQLSRFCEGQDFCNGYIMAAYDSNVIYFGNTFCMPASSTGDQIVAVAKKYLLDHPEARHLSAAALVVQSLVQAFPC